MSEFASILVVDDEEPMRRALRVILEPFDYNCVFAENGQEAIARLEETPFDLVITDLTMPVMDGMTLLGFVCQRASPPTVVVVTGHGDIPLALEATRHGAFDFLTKPVARDQLLLSVARALEHHRLQRLGARLSRQIAQVPTYAGLIGQSSPMREVFRLIAQTAVSNANVLVTGESGTGKEKVARAIHANGARRDKPFGIVDCAAIPETLMEATLFGHKAGAFTGATRESLGILGQSDGGTVFFDEIGELPLHLQPKLLRVLQERSYTPVGATQPVSIDVRILAATNRNLEDEVRAGRFREDLFYRFNVLHIEVPPLRARGDDSVGLARFFFSEFSPDYPNIEEIDPEVLDFISAYHWPGNVRELRNVIERAMATAQSATISVTDLPPRVREDSPAGMTTPVLHSRAALTPQTLGGLDDFVQAAKLDYVRQALALNKGNVSQAARHAGVSRKTFYKMMEESGIARGDSRE